MKGTLAILITSFVHISENLHLKIMQPYNLAYHKFNKHIFGTFITSDTKW